MYEEAPGREGGGEVTIFPDSSTGICSCLLAGRSHTVSNVIVDDTKNETDKDYLNATQYTWPVAKVVWSPG